MLDDIEERLKKVTDAIIEEFIRQDVAKALAELNIDVPALAKAVVMAADGRVIKFPPPLAP